MPAKNVIKTYVKDGYYHLYNRGVEKRNIYEDEQDFKVFLKYLKEYLSPPQENDKVKKSFTLKGSTFKGVPRQPNNFSKEISLIAYSLMPNHFHLLLKQNSERAIKVFMQSLNTRYVIYFNKKYSRVGSLFQGIYKGVLVKNDEYLLHLSRYIHLNPAETTSDITKAYSSYGDYLGVRHINWVKPKIILDYFNNSTIPEIRRHNSYKSFVEDYSIPSKVVLGSLIIER